MKKLQQKNLLSAAVTALLCTAVVVPFAASAGSVTLSGQVNRMIANIDNGADSNLQFLDNTGSGTRFRLKGEQDIGNGMKVGVYWETQYQSNSSNGVDASTIADTTDGAPSTRHRDLYFKGDFGKISLGQGSGAADNIAETDLSGTNYIVGHSGNYTFGSVTFGGTAVKVKDVYNNMDSLGRNDRLRYDSPKLGSVVLSLDMGMGGKTEAAIRFSTKIDGNTIKASLGTWDQNDAGTKSGTSIGIAYLHNSGFNASFVNSTQDVGNADDQTMTMLTVGYKTGPHAMAVRIGTAEDITPGVSTDKTVIGYVNRSLKSTELYAGLTTYSADIAGAQDISILSGGARVKF